MRRSLGKFLAAPIMVFGIGALLSGCASEPATPVAPASAPAAPSIAADSLVGKWGLASYHNEADRARTETAARGQCNKPYVIGKGQAGGVMMHVADQTEPQEMFVKPAEGRNFLGPAGPPGVAQDLEILSFDKGVLVMSWMDPDTASRYGTMVYARCKTK
jgi:hypothetical protein